MSAVVMRLYRRKVCTQLAVRNTVKPSTTSVDAAAVFTAFKLCSAPASSTINAMAPYKCQKVRVHGVIVSLEHPL